MAERECQWCGKTFIVGNHYRKYCCLECANAAETEMTRLRRGHRVKRDDGKYQQECIRCGKSFLAEDYRTRICPECKAKPAKAEVKARKPRKQTLAETAVEAKKNGMSYGQMMALRYQDEQH